MSQNKTPIPSHACVGMPCILKSGGPVMVINEVHGNRVTCVWFTGSWGKYILHEHIFHQDALLYNKAADN